MAKRMLDCYASDFREFTKEDLLESIMKSEGRVIACETIGTLQPMLGNVTNAEFVAAMGADILLLNMFDVINPVINGLPETKPEDTVKELKRLTGRPIGINLEPVEEGEEGETDPMWKMSPGRRATVENAKRAAQMGVDMILLTGNPVRKEILECRLTPEQARTTFGLDPEKPTVLVVGGSLGARTLNESIRASLQRFASAGVQLIWQTGKAYGDKGIQAAKGMRGVVVTQFLTDMATAYRAASLVVSRAGAGSISELELLGKACVLVPSPNVAEDHQTKNAHALSDRGAAITVPDIEAREKLADIIFSTVADCARLERMSAEIRKLALPDSDNIIAAEVSRIVNF